MISFRRWPTVPLATLVALLIPVFIASAASALPAPPRVGHTVNLGPASRHCTQCVVRGAVKRRRSPARARATATAATGSSSKHPAAPRRTPTGPNLGAGLVVGINANTAGWGGASTQGRIAQVVSMTQSKWLRETFVWSTIEPTDGTFDFSYYDHYMLLASQAGEHILPVLYGTPSWAGATSSSFPSDPSTYAAFVAAVVDRYGPHGSFWTENPSLSAYAITTFELWNEPYYSNGDGGNYDPAAYANLIAAAGAAAHAADPAAKVLLAADTDAGAENGDTWVNWIDALYQAVPNLNNYFDGIAVHPYGPDTTDITGDGDNQIRRVEMIRADFVAHGAADKPLWITEIGWPTCNGTDVMCTTAANQLNDVNQLITYLHTTWQPYVKAVFLYDMQDLGTDLTNPEDNYGLYTYAGTAKPALATWEAFEATTALSS